MIQVENLCFCYPGAEKETLSQLSFSIDQGEIFGFLGPSGAGKSTTQKILYKILKQFKGEIKIDNKPLNHLGNEYLENVGVGFELPNHYLKLSGRENLELFATFYKKDRLIKIDDLFEMVGLEEDIDQRVEKYSKGMQMRLNFIRAIMHQPDILFFDEPTAGLDPINAHKIKQLILGLKAKGKTIFITTHNMNTADELCDRVAFIVEGRLQLTERPSVLKRQHGEKKVIVESEDGNKVDFSIEGLGTNPSFLTFIKDRKIMRINTSEASLEEVFINITGKTLKQ